MRLVKECNLYGYEGLVWQKFRYQQLLTPDLQRLALMNMFKLQKEDFACLLFDVQMQILKKLNFVYETTQGMPVFHPDFCRDRQPLSCIGASSSFVGLLYS